MRVASGWTSTTASLPAGSSCRRCATGATTCSTCSSTSSPRRTGRADLPLDPAVAALLRRRDYPGNVRDLRQLALRIAARHVGPGPITPGDVPDEERATGLWALCDDQDWEATARLLEAAVEAALSAGRGYREIRDAAADMAVRLAVRICGDDLQEAARRLGVTDRMLQKWRAAGRSSTPGHDTDRPDGSSGRPGSPRVRGNG